MRLLVAALCLLALTTTALAADAPPRFIAFSADLDARARVIRISTVVADDAGQVLERRYRTTIRYRCGTIRWKIARRTRPTRASIDLRWRYPTAVRGSTCQFRAVVTRGRRSATSRIVTATIP